MNKTIKIYSTPHNEVRTCNLGQTGILHQFLIILYSGDLTITY